MGVIHHDHEKASRYIDQLDSARTSARWAEIPELVRKISKHAPARKCLILAAKADAEISSYITNARRPGSPQAALPLPEAVASSLEAEIRAAGQQGEDILQAQSALLWARWLTPQEKTRPIPGLSIDPARAAADASSTWTKICVLKAVYIQGMLLQQSGQTSDGREVHQSLLPWLDSNRSLVVATPQLLYWAQQLLAQVALSGDHAPGTASFEFDSSSSFRLRAFRHWAVLAAKSIPGKSKSALASTYGNAPGHLSDLVVWRAYYRFLSAILHNRAGASRHVSISRSDLAVEIRSVETSYETELLRHTQFPKATESNAPVEEWVEEVISNWALLCGLDQGESFLDENARNTTSRNVLDILYRATTKTFHSTLILRRLFQVHKNVTDFDLAYRALDTYIQLMDKGRERAAKSNELAEGQDDDYTYLETIAEGIEGLCSFGRLDEAEKAYGLSTKLEDLLDELEDNSHISTPNGVAPANGQINGHRPWHASASPDLLNTVYRAIGIGKSHWAKWTPYSEKRTSLQTEAIEILRRAAQENVSKQAHLKTLFALARLLAETREIGQAIAVVKEALATGRTESSSANSHTTQRNLIPFWHLLSLLLTSRQDFGTAEQSCAAAVEQFSPPEVLLGPPSDEVPDVGVGTTTATPALVDDMECGELQRLIEIRITELALTELNEGHEHAVNSSNDLLALYARLFGRFGEVSAPTNVSKPKSTQPPKSSAGTIKSSRASIFSRRKVVRSSETARAPNQAPMAEEKIRPSTQATTSTQAPTIHVTNEDEAPSPHKHRLFRTSHEHHRHEKRTSSGTTHSDGTRRRLSRSRSRGRHDKEKSQANSDGKAGEAQNQGVTKPVIRADRGQGELPSISSEEVPALPAGPVHDTSEKAKQTLNPVPHNLAAHDQVPAPAKHEHQPPEQDIRLPDGEAGAGWSGLVTRFPKAVKQRHAMSILVKIWLVVATLYRRSKMFDDSREACDEAAKVALKVETMIAATESSARAFSEAGWGGGGKSSDELWADVYCERAELLLAIALEREEKEGTAISEGVRQAVEQYEQCLMYSNNHAGGIVGLSNILLDYSERKVELARKMEGGKTESNTNNPLSLDEPFDDRQRQHRRNISRVSEDGGLNGGTNTNAIDGHGSQTQVAKDEELKKTPENLNRLAARDRAYGLLSTLTKLGTGWDNSEAWYALARAHELGGEVDKAKEILWWCVELEDTRPIRHWRNVGGGYVL